MNNDVINLLLAISGGIVGYTGAKYLFSLESLTYKECLAIGVAGGILVHLAQILLA